MTMKIRKQLVKMAERSRDSLRISHCSTMNLTAKLMYSVMLIAFERMDVSNVHSTMVNYRLISRLLDWSSFNLFLFFYLFIDHDSQMDVHPVRVTIMNTALSSRSQHPMTMLMVMAMNRSVLILIRITAIIWIHSMIWVGILSHLCLINI